MSKLFAKRRQSEAELSADGSVRKATLVRVGPIGTTQAVYASGDADEDLAFLRPQTSQAMQWINAGYILQITVRKACNLGGSDAPDAYVKLLVGTSDEPSKNFKASSRTVYNNHNPIYEETFQIPLSDASLEDTQVSFVVMSLAYLLKDTVLGQAKWRLSMLLGYLGAPGVPYMDRFSLNNKSDEVTEGQLEASFLVLPPDQINKSLGAGKERYSPASLQSRFGSLSLQLHMGSVSGLRTAGGADTVSKALKDLRMELRVGVTFLREEVQAEQMVVESMFSTATTVAVKFAHQLVLPLDKSFLLGDGKASAQTGQELGDVFITMYSGSVAVLKAQFPLWRLIDDQDSPLTSQDLRLPMERLGQTLLSPVELECTAELIPHVQNEQQGAATTEVHAVGDLDQEDTASSAPLDASKVPAPLDTVLVQEEVPCGPNRLYNLLVHRESTLMPKIWEKERVYQIQVPEWSGEGSCRTRSVTYKRTMTVPVLGTQEINVREVHTLAAKEPGGWVLNSEISTDAKFGDYFVVLTQVVARKGSRPLSTSLRVTMKMDWKKSTMLKSTIEPRSVADSKTHWTDVVAAARTFAAAQASAPAAGAAAAAEPAAGAAEAAAGTAAQVTPAPAVAPAAAGLLPGWLQGALPQLVLLAVSGLLLLLLLLSWRQNAALQRQVAGLQQQLITVQSKVLDDVSKVMREMSKVQSARTGPHSEL